MNLTRWPVTVAYAFLLLSCAGFALFQTWGFMFAMGEAETPVGLGIGAFLIVTLLGAAGLVIGALGSWSQRPVYSGIPLVSGLCVFPAAVLFCSQGGMAWQNMQFGAYYSGPIAWATVLLPVPLELAALLFSGLRFRKFTCSV